MTKQKRTRENSKSEETKEREEYEQIKQENKFLENYYKKIIPPKEWEIFLKTLKTELPSSFRIIKNQKQILSKLNSQIIHEFEGNLIHPPKQITFIPNAYEYANRRILRKSPSLENLHSFLVRESEIGNISRQEVVSMIPPLFLLIEPHHYVLDCCAAPGSKTLQLLEALHSKCREGEIPTGCVIANDENNKRAYLLVHRTKAIQSPCLLVTNHDASRFPSLYTSDTREKLLFDRILCDVPCSGDGTSRKNLSVWKEWTYSTGNNLHSIQSNILFRAVQLCKPGGRIVYSTCSMNPVENEAVVANILRKGGLKLVDCDRELPGLVRCPGISKWAVFGKNGEYERFCDVGDGEKLKESLFPPTEEEAKEMNLERCIRVYPHLQNTGGFFIAVLEKLDTDNKDIKEVRGYKKSKGFKESPFILLKSDSKDIKTLYEYYDISSSFPKDQFLVRNADQHKHVYFVSKGVKNILETEQGNVKYVYTGVKACARHKIKKEANESEANESEGCEIRLHQEILTLLVPHLGSRKLTLTKQELITSLKTEFPKFTEFSIDTQEKLESMSLGGCVFIYGEITVAVWRAKCSVNVLLSKGEREGVLGRLCDTDE